MKKITLTKLSWLSFFRISIAAICLCDFAALQADFALLFYKDAYSVPEISRFLSESIIPSFYDIHKWLNQYLHIDYDTILLVFRIIYPLSLLLLLLGFYTRLSAILSLLLFSLFVNSYYSLCYGFDVFANFSLFYCVIFPVGKYNARTKNKKRSKYTDDKRFLYLLQAHLCVAYFFSGFEKLLGFNWRNGESLWKALHSLSANELINLDFLANTPLFTIMGWVTIILEMLYGVFMNYKKTRKMWLAGIIGLHLSIAILMNLYFFSAIMVILNLAAYYIPYWKEKDSENFYSNSVPEIPGISI